MRRSIVPAYAICSFIVAAALSPVAGPAQTPAQVSATSAISGVVLDDQGKPVSGATVKLSGPRSQTVTTAADGTFALRELPPGLFRVDVSKGGFSTSTLGDIALLSGDKSDVRITLRAASFTSLRQIGNVSATTGGRNTINTAPAAIAVVSGSTFSDQGQLSVTRVLNQIPGIVISPPSNNGGVGYLANGSSPLATGIPQIRGALPYETASLIDGHPISIGAFGTFNPAFINPYILNDVEVVKGPGATGPNIDYAIGGTVNFRTLEPTRTNKFSADSGIDQWGGNFLNLRATGTLQNSGLSYAFDYASQGTQGYARGFTTNFAPISFYGPNTVNGVPMCGAFQYPCTSSTVAGNPHFVNGVAINANLVQTDQPVDMSSSEHNELAKIRYALTPTTSLTLSYLGAQQRGALVGGELFTLPITTFVAPPGYTGSFPTNTPIPFDLASSNGSLAETWANLYQAEFRTALGKSTTLLLRYYGAGVQTFSGGPGDAGPTPGTLSLTGPLYGGVPLNADTNFTIFNGQNSTLAVQDQYYASRTYDKLGGITAEIDKQFGDNVLSIAYDQLKTKSSAETEASIAAYDTVIVPVGSAQLFKTLMIRGQFALTPSIVATLSNNTVVYTDTYTQDNGLTFQNATHGYNAPRFSAAWRADRNTSVRGSAGWSIAPPYINLLTNAAGIQPSQITPPSYYTETKNAGDIAPETSFGFDLGVDRRLPSYNTVSFDAYQTTLRNQFLTQTTSDGLYTPPSGPFAGITAPLYITKTANLGHSRYEGLELSVHRDPPTGYGYKIQGNLMRAYPYDLPPGFYDTAQGPNTTNLGVIGNINFQGSGFGFNGLSYSRVPYAMGYAELNHRAKNGAYFLAGVTYYGSNNGYNQPAFAIGNASFIQPVTRSATLSLTVTNFTGAYNNYYYNFLGGVPVPLKNGLLGYTPGNVIGPSTAQLILHVGL